MDLKSLVRRRDQAMEEIRRLQEEKTDLEESIVKELIGTKQFDFLTVNWKRLHRFTYGHPGKKG